MDCTCSGRTPAGGSPSTCVFEAGGDGLEYLVFSPRHEGDAEIVKDFVGLIPASFFTEFDVDPGASERDVELAYTIARVRRLTSRPWATTR